MLFNSYEFIFVFLPVMFIGYFYLNSKRLIYGSKVWLVLGSLFFYSWWNVAYLPLILSSMLINYAIGTSLGKAVQGVRVSKKSLLTLGIVFNVALLGYFKYTDFLIENVNTVAGTGIELLHLALPLAISFFTFQQIAYLVDSYRGETTEYDFLNYAIFVTFFPQLIAGPIVHHKEMMPQFFSTHNLVRNYRNIALGLFVFSIGLFKKVVIADEFAIWANQGFGYDGILTAHHAWMASISYTFQLYFDFSGYTDMAIGAALLFNIRLPINFNSPYKALNIQDFWHRWHMTLSRFLRDYVYIPLGGNRSGRYRTYFNLFATFLIGGIWHGAGWTFVIWGALHGIGIVIHRVWQQIGFAIPKVVAWFITFNFINITWVFFRAENLESALNILKSMFLLHNPEYFEMAEKALSGTKHFDGILLLVFVVVLYAKNSMQLRETFKPGYRTMIITSVLFFYAVSMMSRVSEFLYFNF